MQVSWHPSLTTTHCQGTSTCLGNTQLLSVRLSNPHKLLAWRQCTALLTSVLLKCPDVPGLLEGAHEGHGLGHHFLRHVQRCRALVHVIDGSSPDPIGDFKAINLELELFNPELTDKPQVKLCWCLIDLLCTPCPVVVQGALLQ